MIEVHNFNGNDTHDIQLQNCICYRPTT